MLCLCSNHTALYCKPLDECWPNETAWNLLSENLGVAEFDGKNKVRKISSLDLEEEYEACIAAGDDAYAISGMLAFFQWHSISDHFIIFLLIFAEAANGICMQTHNCNREFCDSDKEYNLPAYSILVETVEDIQSVLMFSNEHDISVSIKTSGHSYSGSSTQKDSIMIWMAHFRKPKDNETFYQSGDGGNVTDLGLCEEISKDILKIGGGEVWGEVYSRAAKFGKDMIGGGGLTVSAAGGWLQGGGLSALSRSYGLGIDNVVRFEVVLSNGTITTADGCTNSDLFWALRGGGGGTFAVVTNVYVKLYEAKMVTTLNMNFYIVGIETSTCFDIYPECIAARGSNLCSTYALVCPVSCISACAEGKLDFNKYNEILKSFISFWVDSSPYIDDRWGGYWTGSSLMLTFLGNKEDAEITFGKNVTEWIDSLSESQKRSVWFSNYAEHDSYWDSRGRGASTDKTGSFELNLASRHIPLDWIIENKEEAKDLLYNLTWNDKGTIVTSYLLGGAVSAVDYEDTAVNPSIRKAIWSIHTYAYEKNNDEYHDIVRNAVGNNISGSCYNHGSYKEPSWKEAFWGANTAELERLAKIFDPDKRFNCWHCVGYLDPSQEEDTSSSSPSMLLTTAPSAKASSIPTIKPSNIHTTTPSDSSFTSNVQNASIRVSTCCLISYLLILILIL